MTTQGPADHPFELIQTPTSQLPDTMWLTYSEPNQFHRCASEMACVHNMMLRGLNSIYLQAPYIKAQDEKSFLHYSACFYQLVHVHHDGEEKMLFPLIEEMSGEKGIMQHNVEQHHTFDEGLEKYIKYIRDCLDGKEAYQGSNLIAIVDEFGQNLADHLHEEIMTILGLEKYRDKMKSLEETFEKFANKDTAQLPPAGTLSWGFFNHDRGYENGLWKNWPPAPAPVVFMVRYVLFWVHSDWWQFASCDKYGKLRERLFT
ncbi:hypothetical protein CI102_4364 [Trichoderma harzianum]|nr:hypothetical protein CI102_4364 [Trichoderma harzianum]